MMLAVPYSRMGKPHYHRRYGVSLLKEFGMGSGGTHRCDAGKFFVLSTQFFIASAALPALVNSVTYFCMLLPFLRLPPCQRAQIIAYINSESVLKIVFSSAKTSSAL
ncbi:hypothetical protein KCP69_23770 [Salmonella enterica subsp. enterica]|nr:hypothetical protein KCP69_23770 [Salmonella enterica subsp. enterica]